MAKTRDKTMAYRTMLLSISNDLTDQELDTLKFLCRDESIDLQHLGDLEDCKEGFAVFNMLQDKLLLSSQNLGLLLEILSEIRYDLAKKVYEFSEEIEHERIISSYRRMVLKFAYKLNVNEFEDVKHLLTDMLQSRVVTNLKNKIQMMFQLEKHGKISPEKVGSLISIAEGIKRADLEEIVMDYKQAVIGRYEMNNQKRGLCIIINNIKFSKDGLEERRGSEKDQEKLKATFTKLNFDVKEYVNQKAKEMKDVMKMASEQDHSKYDCFVCCIMSHGNLGCVTGTDGETVKIGEMAEPMTPFKCRSLINKPKLFFIESCRGIKYDTKYNTDNVTSYFCSEDGDTQQQGKGSLPEVTDFLFAYATSPGKKAKLEHSGSVYIKKLTEVLNEHHKHFDILSMLTLVNKEVCKEEFSEVSSPGTTFGQAPSPQFTLRKKLYFN